VRVAAGTARPVITASHVPTDRQGNESGVSDSDLGDDGRREGSEWSEPSDAVCGARWRQRQDVSACGGGRPAGVALHDGRPASVGRVGQEGVLAVMPYTRRTDERTTRTQQQPVRSGFRDRLTG